MRYLAGIILVLSAGTGSMSSRAFPQAREHGALSLSVVQTRPLGALGRNIGLGYGLTAAFTLPLIPSGRLSLRVDVGYGLVHLLDWPVGKRGTVSCAGA